MHNGRDAVFVVLCEGFQHDNGNDNNGDQDDDNGDQDEDANDVAAASTPPMRWAAWRVVYLYSADSPVALSRSDDEVE